MRYRVVEFFNGHELRYQPQYEPAKDVWVDFGPEYSLASDAERFIIWRRDHRTSERVVALIGEAG